MKTHSICLVTLSLAFTSATFAGVPTEKNQELVTFMTNAYKIKNASVWSADGPGSINVDWELSKQQWDSVFGKPPRARVGIGAIVEECLLGVCAKAGAAAGIEVEAYVLPYFEAELQPGTFDATVNYTPTVDYQFGGLGVDFFKLKTDSGFTDTVEFESTFIVKSPAFRVETGLNVSTDLNLFAEACLLGCFVDETYNLASFDFKLPLLEIDTLDSKARIFSPPTNPEDLANLLVDLIANPPDSLEELADTVLYDDISAILGKVTESKWTEYKADLESSGLESDKTKLKKINDAEGFIAESPITLTFTNPFTENAEGEFSDEVASVDIGGRLADVKLDLDQVLGYAFGLKDGAKLSLNSIKGLEDIPVKAELELFNIEAGPTIDLITEVSIAPELMVDITFSEGVLIKGEIGKQTRYIGTWENIPEIGLIAPDPSQPLGIVSYDDVVTATPTFSVEAVLTNRTYLDIAAEIDIQGLRAEIGIDGFDSIDTGFLFDETFTSPSLAQVDLYNASFNTGKWDSPTGDDRNIGTDRVRENPALVPIQGASSNSETLTFDRSGEVVFQARAKTRSDDVALDDDRVQQFMTTAKLTAAEVKLRGFEQSAFDDATTMRGEALNLSSLIDSDGNAYTKAATRLFDFNDETVRRAFEENYHVMTGQSAQVMSDGQFKIGRDETGFFFVDEGATLELGASNFYGSSINSLGSNNNYGVVNEKIFKIDGDVYMAVDESSGGDTDRFKLTNKRQGQLSIGQTGNLKLDGTLESQGVIRNSGSIELTSSNNSSSGLFLNRYAAEIDLYGGLDISGDDWGFGKSLENTGLVSVRNGADLNFIADGRNDALRTTTMENYGEVVIDEGGQVTLKSRSENSLNKFVLQNNHIIDNSGFITNGAGHQIVNGSLGSDWSQYRNMQDPVAAARRLRDASIAPLVSINDELKIATTQSGKDVAAAHKNFISKSAEYINNAKIYNEQLLGLSKFNYDAAVQKSEEVLVSVNTARENFFNSTGYLQDTWYNTLIILQNAHKDALTKENAQKVSLNGATNYAARYIESIIGRNVRDAEALYADTLQAKFIAQSKGNVAYLDIQNKIQRDANKSGLGIVVNEKGATVLNQGTITNHSLLLNKAGADLYNDAGGEINNEGGYIRNNGLLLNQAGGQLYNSGVVDNGTNDIRNTFGVLEIAQLVNLGTLTNESELVNNDTVVNYGVLDNQGSAVITNSGVMNNLGQINNDALLENEAGSEINNHGKFVNNGVITNDGVFNNGQNPNLGKEAEDDDYVQTTFSIAEVIADAVKFYRNKQIVKTSEQGIATLQEQISDSETREGLVKLNLIPLFDSGNSIIDDFLNGLFISVNETITGAYLLSKSAAEAETQAIRDAQGEFINQRDDATNSTNGLASVSVSTFEDKDGNTVVGSQFINLAAISSVNSAELENNGTFDNRGLFNNIGTITNNEDAVISNSGVLIVGQEGVIDNDGSLLVEEVSINRTAENGEVFKSKQSGMLISNGTINNTGLIDISAGTLVNGTFASASNDPIEANTAIINNNGDILISGVASRNYDINERRLSGEDRTASLINQGTINNQAGGNIKIGDGNAFVSDNQLFAVNALINMGDIVNEGDASIENNGVIYNSGSIDNKAGSSLTNTGLINNTESGTIDFAESATLGGYVNNNGFITMQDDQILTLTGNISGSGTFVGSTLIQGLLNDPSIARKQGKYSATVNPGNSPGLLTFNGDVENDNVNWIMEIWGTDRGIGYDGVDVLGDFTLTGGMSMTILALLDFDTLMSQEFNFLSISGDLFNTAGERLVNSFEFLDFSASMADNWAGNWMRSNDGWDLNFSFIADNTDLYKDLRITARVDVPEPSMLLLLSGFVALFWRARNKAKAKLM